MPTENNSEQFWNSVEDIPSSLKNDGLLIDFLRSQHVRSVIDFGCGSGELLKQIRSLINVKLCGIDINSNGIETAKSLRVPNTLFNRENLLNISDEIGIYELGLLKATLTAFAKLEDRRKVFREISRKVDKYLYISDFKMTCEHPRYLKRYSDGLDETGEIGSFNVYDGVKVLYQAHHFTTEEVTTLLFEVGFQVDKILMPKVKTRSGYEIDGIQVIAQRL